MRLVLASSSPQRREILQRIGVEFEVQIPAVKELAEGEPADVALTNALAKAEAVVQQIAEEDRPEPATVIAVDTVVALDGDILGKPETAKQAFDYVTALAGRWHDVYSGIAVVETNGSAKSDVAKTAVCFRELLPQNVENYVKTGEWRNRAGGYAIQLKGGLLVREISGDYSNVVGLPMALLVDLLPQIGFLEA